MAEYKLSYTGQQINEKLGMIEQLSEEPGYYEVTLTEALLGSGFNAIRFCINGFTENTICTINEEITE